MIRGGISRQLQRRTLSRSLLCLGRSGSRHVRNNVIVAAFSSQTLTGGSVGADSDATVSRDSHRRSMSTEISSRLYENNSYDHSHMPPPPPPQEWASYEGKLPVLTEHDKRPSSGVLGMTNYDGDTPRTSVLMELTDRVGVLHDVLRYFWKFDVNICRIESRPAKQASPTGQLRGFDFFVDMEGSPSDDNVGKLLDALRPMCDKLLILDEKKVHWFPRHISELDLIANRTLIAGVDLMSEDHPGFHDEEYRARRDDLSIKAQNHRWDQPIPRIEYTQDEVAVWSAVWDKMEGLWEKYACREFLHALDLMKKYCGYGRDQIPQQEDISKFLQRRTNFRMRPVAGLLSSRDFLNGLAFRVFFSTQYIRHHSRPLYTPEPDLVHEFCGHAPMFVDQSFADFSQEIGLASLGASDEDIEKLARCYWHSVEFGMCRQDGENKAYGAGLLSSFGELEYACSESHPGADEPPEIKPWDPEVAAYQDFPITSYQPIYFLAESLDDAKTQMRRYCEDLPRPFFAQHNSQTDTIHIDRPVVRTKGCPVD